MNYIFKVKHQQPRFLLSTVGELTAMQYRYTLREPVCTIPLFSKIAYLWISCFKKTG